MSNAVFPALAGLGWGITRAPQFKTIAHRAMSGSELRGTFQQYPLWSLTLNYEFLRDGSLGADYDTIIGFFLARQGSFDSFLFTDWADNAVVDQNFGVGTGSATTFQLVRSFGGGGFTFTEPVQNANAITNVKVDGVTKTAGVDYTVGSTGIVTFASPPAAAAALTWTGSYYYRCRFVDDISEASQFMQNLWEMKKCPLIGAPGNKV
jgi:uncharacterized protein (TIGR02217 family)